MQWTTATASGARRACSSASSWRWRSAGYGAAVSFHVAICRNSGSVSSGRSPTRSDGSARAALSSTPRCPAKRRMVSASNRSVAYSTAPVSAWPEAVREIDRSNFAVPPWRGSGSAATPGRRGGPARPPRTPRRPRDSRPRGPAGGRRRRGRAPRQAEGLGQAVLHHQQDLEQRAARQVAGGPQILDELFERDVLERVSGERRLPRARGQRGGAARG